MANPKIQTNLLPSSAYTVGPDTTIGHCIRIMRDRGFGSVLITNPQQTQILGIFTERDVLKWIDEIQHGGHWNKPVSVLMSKPVRTISIDELDQAAEMMLKHRIRHLPVVYNDPTSGQELTGMVSMRDLVRNFIEREKQTKSATPPISIATFVTHPSLRHLLKKLSISHGNATITHHPMELALAPQKLPDLSQVTAAVIDLDDYDTADWSSLLQRFENAPHLEHVYLLYNPLQYRDQTLDALAKLSASKRFTIFAKPINAILLLNRWTHLLPAEDT